MSVIICISYLSGFEWRILSHCNEGNKLKQKNSYRDKASRHPSFRHQHKTTWQRLPLGLLLLAVVMFFIVRGFDRLRGRENIQSSRISNTRHVEKAEQSVSPTEKEYQATSNAEQQTKGSHRLSPRIEPANAYSQVESAPPQHPLNETGETLQHLMQKDAHGNITGFGTINGKGVRFLADTGATTVIVPEKIAQQIGLSKGKPTPFTTAGGEVVHYLTNLDSLKLGQIELRNIPAAINPAIQSDIVLLGMSALSQLDIQMQQGNLLLKYKPTYPDSIEAQPTVDQPFTRSYKECAEHGNKFDQKSLDCLRGK